MTTVILDNGASRIKYGLETHTEPRSMSNNTAQVRKQMLSYVGDQVDSALNGSVLQYNRPFDHGYLNKMDIEIQIWNRLFSSSCLSIKPSEMNLVVTEPPFNLECIQNDMNEVIFEEYGFQNYMRRIPAWFSAYEYSRNPPAGAENPDCCTVIDSGFSFTHILPFIALKCQKNACKRVDVGGKLLTNYLKEVVSYRQWNMMDEFKLIDQVKEELCYVSTNLRAELKHSRNPADFTRKSHTANDPFGLPMKRNFVLPDFDKLSSGYVKPHDESMSESEQLLVMETERFCIPEVLFQPQIVGLNQGGVTEALSQAYNKFNHLSEIGLVSANIILTGGCVKMPQFEERFLQEARPIVPDMFPMQTYLPLKPDEYAWQGARRFVTDQQQEYSNPNEWMKRMMVSKDEYLEYGHYHCNKKFLQELSL